MPSVEDIALIRDWSLQGVSPFNDHATNQRSFSVSLSFFPPFSFLFTGTAANTATLQTKHLFHPTPTLFIYVIAMKYCKNFEAFEDMSGCNMRLLLLQFHKKTDIILCFSPAALAFPPSVAASHLGSGLDGLRVLAPVPQRMHRCVHVDRGTTGGVYAPHPALSR